MSQEESRVKPSPADQGNAPFHIYSHSTRRPTRVFGSIALIVPIVSKMWHRSVRIMRQQGDQ